MQPGQLFLDSDSIYVPGNGTRVSGSKIVAGRDPGQVQYFELRRVVEVAPIPKDEQGRDYVLCGDCGQYVNPRGFARDPKRKNGLDNFCKQCRQTRAHVIRMQQAEQEGRELHARPGRPRGRATMQIRTTPD